MSKTVEKLFFFLKSLFLETKMSYELNVELIAMPFFTRVSMKRGGWGAIDMFEIYEIKLFTWIKEDLSFLFFCCILTAGIGESQNCSYSN